MPRLARCAALLPLLAALLFAASPAAEAKCSVDDLQISGAYICYEADSIVGYEDGTVRDSPAVNKDTAIANGISEGSWYYLKPGEQNGHSFVMFTGTADRNGSTSFDIDSDGDGATYVVDGSVESKQVCSLKASQTPYWTANCLVIGAEDFFMELEMVASEDDECETTAIYQNLVVPKITVKFVLCAYIVLDQTRIVSFFASVPPFDIGHRTPQSASHVSFPFFRGR